jgi:hypothetical protein
VDEVDGEREVRHKLRPRHKEEQENDTNFTKANIEIKKRIFY